MTQKKKQILNTALELFSDKGFAETSTSSIAKEAKVSEGLIFKHFGNKNGLLDAILDLGKEKATALFTDIVMLEKPEEQLKSIISIPFTIPKSDHRFWKLIYALKWQAEEYDNNLSSDLKEILIHVFTKLLYKDPELEANFVLMLFDGMATSVLLKGIQDQTETLEFIYYKYNLS